MVIVFAPLLSSPLFISVNIKSLGFGTRTPLLCRGRTSWHVGGRVRAFAFVRLSFGDRLYISICHFD